MCVRVERRRRELKGKARASHDDDGDDETLAKRSIGPLKSGAQASGAIAIAWIAHRDEYESDEQVRVRFDSRATHLAARVTSS